MRDRGPVLDILVGTGGSSLKIKLALRA